MNALRDVEVVELGSKVRSFGFSVCIIWQHLPSPTISPIGS